MPYLKMTPFRWCLFVILTNVLLTAWMVYAVPTLDYDAILYITAAKAIASDNWQLSSELYRGSLYPYLIFLSHKVSGFSYEISAHLLNALFFSLTSYAFVRIVQELGGNSKAIAFFSLAVILFFPGLLKYRPDIFREFGFFACYFWSILFLLIFSQTRQKKYLLAWFSLLFIGIFFRIESVVFLFGISAIMLFEHTYKKIKTLNKAALLIGLVVLIAFVFLMFFGVKSLNNEHPLRLIIGYPLEYINKAMYELNQKLFVDSVGLIGVLKAIFEPIGSILYVVLQRFEVVYALLVVMAYKLTFVFLEANQKKIILYYLFMSLVTLILFQVSLGYLTARYALTFVLTAIIVVPFVLEKLFHLMSAGRLLQRASVAFLFLILCALSVKRLGFSDRDIEINSGQWVLANVAEKSVVASNNSKILYYANRFPYLNFGNKDAFHRYSTRLLLSKHNEAQLKRAEYIVLLVRPSRQADLDMEEKFKRMHGESIQRLEQKDSDTYVSVYEVK